MTTSLANECELGRVVGPPSEVELGAATPIHVSRFRVIPKGHQVSKWSRGRVIAN